MEEDLTLLNEGFEETFKDTYDTHAGFDLFRLPTELWLRICELTVVQAGPIEITRAYESKDQERIVEQPAISRTCKLLRREALTFFYGKNDWVAWHEAEMACIRDWFQAIGPEHVRTMGTFTFHAEYDDGFWLRSFGKMGMKVSVRAAEEQTEAVRRRDLKTLIITFL